MTHDYIKYDRRRKREIESARESSIDKTLPKVRTKDASVILNGAHLYPEIAFIIQVAREVAPALKNDTIVITSANDGKHKKNSKHYSNEAFDLRIRNVIGGHLEIERWSIRMREKLGKDYQVIYGDPTHRDHIHVEFDPK